MRARCACLHRSQQQDLPFAGIVPRVNGTRYSWTFQHFGHQSVTEGLSAIRPLNRSSRATGLTLASSVMRLKVAIRAAALAASWLRLLTPGRLALCNRRPSTLCEARKPLGWADDAKAQGAFSGWITPVDNSSKRSSSTIYCQNVIAITAGDFRL